MSAQKSFTVVVTVLLLIAVGLGFLGVLKLYDLSVSELDLKAQVRELEGELAIFHEGDPGLSAEVEKIEDELDACEDEVKAVTSSANMYWTKLLVCNEAKVQCMNELGASMMTQEDTGENVAADEPPAEPSGQESAQTQAPGDPVVSSLQALGFRSRAELISYFQIEGVEERELATCPEEDDCIRILREKDEEDYIKPFRMMNPTAITFDGWRAAAGQPSGWDGNQAKVPPGGPWMVEGVTLKPWR